MGKSTATPAVSSTAKVRKAKRAGAHRKPAEKRGHSPRAIETVLATFAHDIRTPLTGILAFSELLATSGLGEREGRWVEAIKDSAGHLAELTTLAVEAARAGAGHLELRRETFALPRFAARLALSFAARAEAKGLACETQIQGDLPDHVAGDPALLRAAIENLMANAVKFTERGQVGLRIKAAPLARGKLALSFTVSDSGIGMSDVEIARLFRPFAQASKEIAERFGGSGLGLVQVRRLARSMHGDLTVESTPGRGSAFHLNVVLGRARPPVSGAAADRALPKGEALAILCVDDNPYGRVVMNAIVTELGHHATFAGSAEAALAALTADSVDVVLMDVALAGIDGYEATRRIRALPGRAGRVTVIGIACQGEADQPNPAAAAVAAGMDACLTKPLSPRVLADALTRVRGEAVAGG